MTGNPKLCLPIIYLCAFFRKFCLTILPELCFPDAVICPRVRIESQFKPASVLPSGEVSRCPLFVPVVHLVCRCRNEHLRIVRYRLPKLRAVPAIILLLLLYIHRLHGSFLALLRATQGTDQAYRRTCLRLFSSALRLCVTASSHDNCTQKTSLQTHIAVVNT